jgi:hypothetical protein
LAARHDSFSIFEQMHSPKPLSQHDGVTNIIAAVHALDLASAEVGRSEKALASTKAAHEQA